MRNKIDTLIEQLRNTMHPKNTGPVCQQDINDKTLAVIEEINKILRTCERLR